MKIKYHIIHKQVPTLQKAQKFNNNFIPTLSNFYKFKHLMSNLGQFININDLYDSLEYTLGTFKKLNRS